MAKVGGVCYKAFHGYGQAKFPDVGSILGSSQFTLLPQLPPKIMRYSKAVKIKLKNNHLASLI